MPDQTETGEDITLDWYVKAGSGENAPFAKSCAAEAEELVARFVGAGEVPAAVRSRAVLEVGADLYYRRAARNGVVNFGNGVEAASVVRINRDPMTQAYPLLTPYLGLGFA